jgi:hypothetical protein
MLNKDHFIFGLAIGILVPVILFALILGMNYLLILMGVAKFYLDLKTHILISFFGNLLPIRYYFVNLTFDKTGRGVLIVTFAAIIVFFAFQGNIIAAQ